MHSTVLKMRIIILCCKINSVNMRVSQPLQLCNKAADNESYRKKKKVGARVNKKKQKKTLAASTVPKMSPSSDHLISVLLLLFLAAVKCWDCLGCCWFHPKDFYPDWMSQELWGAQIILEKCILSCHFASGLKHHRMERGEKKQGVGGRGVAIISVPRKMISLIFWDLVMAIVR